MHADASRDIGFDLEQIGPEHFFLDRSGTNQRTVLVLLCSTARGLARLHMLLFIMYFDLPLTEVVRVDHVALTT